MCLHSLATLCRSSKPTFITLATVVARQVAEHATWNPQQELHMYLEAPLEQVENIIEWWGVSLNSAQLTHR
jgi:hypothetical protein